VPLEQCQRQRAAHASLVMKRHVTGLARTVYMYAAYDRIFGGFLPKVPYIQQPNATIILYLH